MADDTTILVDQGQGTERFSVDVAGSRFRVRTPQCSTQGLPETPSNRHMTVVWLRLLRDEYGKTFVTLQELAERVGSANRQAASQHGEDCRQCGEECRPFGLRKRKGDARVVEAVLAALLKPPLAGPTELLCRVNAQLGRRALTVANIDSALEQIACRQVLRVRRRQLEAGQRHYQEAYLLAELLESVSSPAAQAAHWRVSNPERGMKLADPTALAALVPPEVPLEQITDSLGGRTILMTLFYWNVPVSVLGRWCGVHQTTIFRWVLGLALALWPSVSQWIGEQVRAQMVYGEEKWLKSQGRWHYWYVVLDVRTELPLLAALLPSRSQWACRWIGRQLTLLKQVPRVIITDGLQAYAYLLPGAKHILGRFHHQQGVTQWLRQHFATPAAINARKPVMKKVFQTEDKRPVRRRLARVRAQASELGILPWVSQVEAKLPRLICRVGSVRLPSTTNAIERFFRAFQRVYATRGGFHSVLSAKPELLLVVVVYVFTPHATTGQAPIEVIVPEARRMPLYRLIHDPFNALQERGHVKETPKVAALLLGKAAAA